MEELQISVIEIVFSHLPKTDLLQATLISPKANQIISNSVRLIKNFRVKIIGDQQWPGTRKYSKIDFRGLEGSSMFADLPAILTELTFECCKFEADDFHGLLSKVSDKLELLIIHDCVFNDNSSGQEDIDDEYEELKILQPTEEEV